MCTILIHITVAMFTIESYSFAHVSCLVTWSLWNAFGPTCQFTEHQLPVVLQLNLLFLFTSRNEQKLSYKPQQMRDLNILFFLNFFAYAYKLSLAFVLCAYIDRKLELLSSAITAVDLYRTVWLYTPDKRTNRF